MMRFLPVNDNTLLVELDDLEQTLALLASLTETPVTGIEELVPAARTILVQWRTSACSRSALVDAISQRDISARAGRDGTLIEIPVDYSGEDLAEVAALLGITPEEVIRRHTGSTYSVAFTGFAPGFAYLSGGHPSLNVPRRSTPRTRIPAGAVGLAGTFSGVYPQASPGGWQIIGVTPSAMWDLAREVPALLQPGFRVQFVDRATLSPAARERLTVAAIAQPAQAAAPRAVDGIALEIQSAGLQTLFQDLGRPGLAAQGVSASGAMDQAALKAANRLVGNASHSAGLENIGGLRVRSAGDTVVAVTGADAPQTLTTANGQQWQAARYQPLALTAGDTLHIGQPQAGLRSYVAVRGGFAVAPVLGSCSTDTLAHVGPKPLAAGDVLAIRPHPHGAAVGLHEEPPADLPTVHDVVTLDVVLGPRTDWFTAASLERLRSQLWQVTPQSNRVGLRLAGELPLERAVPDELPSEGTPWGAIQVPPSGQPVLFLADHPLTGGYPVIGCVATHHLNRAGQIPVHAWVRFNPLGDFAPATRVAGDSA
jgi:KipI family sensor histidine kinase inhibitor